MATQVMFYLLESQDASSVDLTALHACFQAAYFYRQNQRVFVYTHNQQHAHQIDELLWSFDPDSFVPHNLPGEGPNNGAPVEISWQAPTNRRAILINLTSTAPSFAQQFNHVIDFVPHEESLKQQARERYKSYRQQGFIVENQPAKPLAS